MGIWCLVMHRRFRFSRIVCLLEFRFAARPLPYGHGFHERAAPCQAKSFGRLSNNRGSPTLREARCSVPTIFLPQKGFSAFRRFALLPFALLSGAFAPVPVGILNLKSGAAISVPN